MLPGSSSEPCVLSRRGSVPCLPMWHRRRLAEFDHVNEDRLLPGGAQDRGGDLEAVGELAGTARQLPRDRSRPTRHTGVSDPHEAVTLDVARLRSHPRLSDSVTVIGVVHDVATGQIDTVSPPAS